MTTQKALFNVTVMNEDKKTYSDIPVYAHTDHNAFGKELRAMMDTAEGTIKRRDPHKWTFAIPFSLDVATLDQVCDLSIFPLIAISAAFSMEKDISKAIYFLENYKARIYLDKRAFVMQSDSFARASREVHYLSKCIDFDKAFDYIIKELHVGIAPDGTVVEFYKGK